MSLGLVVGKVDLNIVEPSCPQMGRSVVPWNDLHGLGLQRNDKDLATSQASIMNGAVKSLVLGRSRTYYANERNFAMNHMDNKTLTSRTLGTGASERSLFKRRSSLQLPSFESLGIFPGDPLLCVERCETMSLRRSVNRAEQSISSLHGTVLPLTPPLDTTPSARASHTTSTDSNLHSMTQAGQENASLQSNDLSLNMLPSMRLLEVSDLSHAPQLRGSTWIVRLSQRIVAALSSVGSHDTLQMVSQTLPSQATDSRSRPTFEDVLERLQTDLTQMPYVTITHAVPQARIMEELPKTPPSTPNYRHESVDYFGSDQTIFTHAAVVPIYHSHDRSQARTAERLAHHIAAPCSTQVSILERYIPPTLPQEIDDFFSPSSSRSYLADRLSELSSNNGSLLLVYPTLRGGSTFKRQYLDPVLDPYLRQFVMLNDLTSDAAALMGEMVAVPHMLEFEEMQRRVVSMCQTLSERPVTRGQPSAFHVAHAEAAEVTLDYSTWTNWFVEQEQSRIKLNLVQYHQAGNRMPESTDKREITVGMLARDFIDGIPKSRESTDNAEFEVGIFLITRSLL